MIIRIGRREARAWRCFRDMLGLASDYMNERNALYAERAALANEALIHRNRADNVAMENARLRRQLAAKAVI
jgi:hypothetical protein